MVAQIGIIGLGDMGKLYAKTFAREGYRVSGCDVPEKRSQLEEELKGTGISILEDGIAVSRRSDLIVYSVEAERIDEAVRIYGPSTKQGAIVTGQTSVMTPEVKAFEKFLPEDVNIIPCHSLHGPTVNPVGQSLAIVRHRSTDEAYARAFEVLSKLGSAMIKIPNYQEHDKMTADTQAVTHIGFESMGTAWQRTGRYPWENPAYVGGIDNVKILMALRIFGGKSHVYSGLAMLNPFAKEQIRQYAQSVSELFKLMIQEDREGFTTRVLKAGETIFGENGQDHILLDDKLMGEFRLGEKMNRRPNSHLSLLAMADTWHNMGINPYQNLICQTPPFKLRLGIVEYLFRDKELLHESIEAALGSWNMRADDLEFLLAVKEWAGFVEHNNTEAYKQQFASTRDFLKDKIPEGMRVSNELIKRLSSRG